MDNKAYLNSIATPPPQPKKSPFFLQPKFLKLLIPPIFCLLAIFIFSLLFSNLQKRPFQVVYQAHLRAKNLTELIEKTNDYLKSPTIRGYNTTVSTTVAELTNHLEPYLNSHLKDFTPDPKIKTSEATQIAQILQNLEDYRLNGLLDRVYPEYISLQLSLLISTLSELSSVSQDQTLLAPVQKTLTSLKIIHQEFLNFSDPSL